MKVHIAVIFLLLAMPLKLISQDIWSLGRCIEHAWANNLTIKQQLVEVTRSENQLLQNKLNFVPTLNASFGHSLNWGRSVDLQNLEIIHNKLSQSTSASANTSIYLLDGLSKLYNLRSSRKSVEISLQEVERLKDEISISIVRSYLQILLSKEMLAASQESFRSISEQRDRTQLLVEAGSQPYTSLLDIESQLASERVQVVTAENQVITNTLALQQLLDLPYSDDFQIETPDIDGTVADYLGDDIGQIIRRSGKTALLVTHDLSEAVSLADRVFVLSRRPATVSRIVQVTFPPKSNTPLQRRNAPEFKNYFNEIWKELNRHE